MTYYKSSKRSLTPISDAAIYFSNHERYRQVFEKEKQVSKGKTSDQLERVREMLSTASDIRRLISSSANPKHIAYDHTS